MKKYSFIKFGLALLFLVGSFAFVCGTSQAAMVWNTDASGELSGSRAATGELTITNSTTKWQALTVAWNITGSSGNWNYEYTFSNIDKDISHFTLEISADADSSDFSHFSGNPIEFGNKDGITNAMKLDFGSTGTSFAYSFDSTRAPVYGDFYLKDGGGNPGLHAYNLDYQNQTATNSGTVGYIVRPNGPVIVPEPSLGLLLGISLVGLVGVGVVRNRNRRKLQ